MEQTLPSAHQIGDKVHVVSDNKGAEFSAIVVAVIFCTGKVNYDLNLEGIIIKDVDSANVHKLN